MRSVAQLQYQIQGQEERLMRKNDCNTLKKLRRAKAGAEVGLLSKSRAFQRPTNPG